MNTAVIGLGYWGPNLVRNLYEKRLCDQIIACDLKQTNLEKIKNRYPSIETDKNINVILKRKDVDAVLIATPVSTHFKLGLESLKAGKHVFIEKPFTFTSEESRQLIQIAEEKKLTLMVGHTFEYSPPIIKIKDIIDKGELGEIYYISTSRVNLGLHQKDVSVIWDLAPHDFSMLFHWLNEEPIRISAMGKDYVQKNIPDVAFINMEFASGIVAHVQVSWLAPSKLRRTSIIGSEKMLVYKDPETFGEYQLSYRAGDVVSPRLDTYEPLHMEIKHFIECCNDNKIPKTDGYNGLRVVKALEAAEKSLRHNSTVVEIKE